MKGTENMFQWKQSEYDNFHFAGVEVETKNDEFLIHRKTNISLLQYLPKNLRP